ncbi:ATP-dependent helicase [Pseudomonas silesiensis]|uniref:ATP-dependent helicase n=1 Tax=Pseudomonas silesiensis TaxID=1853130 RepID=UPI0030D77347
MIKLSDKQAEIVYAPLDLCMQVLASAGSGKTRVLTERIRHILGTTRKDGVIGLTFTNKAADEMNSRLEDVPEYSDRCWISTIHSVAQRIVDQYGHTIGLPSELHIYERDEDRKAVFIQSLVDDGLDVDDFLGIGANPASRAKEIQRYMDEFSFIKRALLTEAEIISRHASNSLFLSIYRKYQEALLESGGIDFDDILVFAHKILVEQGWCGDIYRAKYKHVCVDEAQDLNKAQYEFVKALAAGKIKSVMFVGDPDQMIFGFNGSSKKFLCERFLADFSAIQYRLVENYRSSLAVVDWANKLRPGSQLGMTIALQGVAHIQACEDEDAEARWIASTVANLLSIGSHAEIEGAITLENMVVIGRNRFVFRALEAELSKVGIDYYIKRGERLQLPTSVFGKILDLAIRLKLNPKDWLDGGRLCEALGIDKDQAWGEAGVLIDLAEELRSKGEPLSNVYGDLLLAINELDSDAPNIPKLCVTFSAVLSSLIASSSIEEAEVERSLAELEEFRGCWTSYKKKGLGESLSAFRNSMALGQLSEPYHKTGLTISTVHTMKGLEKDIVFVLGMCEGVFPDYRAVTPEAVDEERNSAFVAITRARRWVYISYPGKRLMPWGDMKFQRRSRFVDELLRP